MKFIVCLVGERYVGICQEFYFACAITELVKRFLELLPSLQSLKNSPLAECVCVRGRLAHLTTESHKRMLGNKMVLTSLICRELAFARTTSGVSTMLVNFKASGRVL